MKTRTLEYINSHPLNKSKTKQAHSFSKSPRFSRVVETSSSGIYYDLSKSTVQCMMNATATSFPRSRRFADQQRKIKEAGGSPSPQSYHSPNFLEMSMKKKKGVPFAKSPKSRNKIDQVPGPGTYTADRYNPEHDPVYTIGRQAKLRVNGHWNKIGPGEYQNREVTRSPSPVIIGRDQRFKYKPNTNPAPGEYYDNKKITDGSNVHRKSPKFTFGSSKRASFVNKDREHSPGPGYYNNQFSQFSERSQRILNILNRL